MFYMNVLGVDPGARHTAMVVVDGEKNVVYAATLEREADEPVHMFAVRCGMEADMLTTKYFCGEVKVEGVVSPKGFAKGKKSFVNPKFVLDLGVVFGGVVGVLTGFHRPLTVVKPGKNGSHGLDSYPVELRGRRPVRLAGVTLGGSRRHERSAFDVAVRAAAQG